MSEDTPEHIELHHFEDLFHGNNFCVTPTILYKNIPTCFNIDLRPCTRVM